jgi:cysteine desulfurase/selenocysteine lyase
MEHHSNLVPWQQLCKQLGIELDYWTIDREGRLDLEDLNQLLSENTKLVAMTAISNVLGSINPIGEVVKRAHSMGAAVFVDAAQAVARIPIDVQKWDCDFLAFSGHKLYGPTGIGVLWVKQKQMQKMSPWQTGGGMISKVDRHESHWASGPAKFEAGTPPVAQAAGLTAAIDFILETGFDSITRHEMGLTQICLDKLQSKTDVEIYGPTNMESRAGVVAFNLRGVHPHDVAQVLNESGIAVRAGHHCTQVLHSKLGLQASVRISVGVYNTEEEILRLVTSLQHVRDLLK